MTITIEQNQIVTTMEEKLKADIEQLRNQLAYARRMPESMTAFYGCTFITMNRLDTQTVELLFSYKGFTLLRTLLQGQSVSFHRFGLEDYVLNAEDTMQLFESVQPALQDVARAL